MTAAQARMATAALPLSRAGAADAPGGRMIQSGGLDPEVWAPGSPWMQTLDTRVLQAMQERSELMRVLGRERGWPEPEAK